MQKIRLDKRPLQMSSGDNDAHEDVKFAKALKSDSIVQIQPLQLVPKADLDMQTPERKREIFTEKNSGGTPLAEKGPAPKRHRPDVDQVAMDLKLMAEKKISERAERKAQEALFQRAKTILKAHGIDYNTHFQPAHKGKMEKGHWQQFLVGVMGRRDIDCPCCQGLIVSFGVSTLEKPELEVFGQPTSSAVPIENVGAVPDGPIDPAPGLAIAPFDPNYTPPKKRARAGRPRKTENQEDDPPQSFNLLEYLEQKRFGMYRLLTKEEATKRLSSDKKRTAQMVDQEFKKRPAQCMLCGVYIHFPHLSNDLALLLGCALATMPLL